MAEAAIGGRKKEAPLLLFVLEAAIDRILKKSARHNPLALSSTKTLYGIAYNTVFACSHFTATHGYEKRIGTERHSVARRG